jgi:ABC-type molybdate transport system ATPase subunit
MALFQHLNQERNITVIYVTHEPDIAAHATRIIQMRDGAVLSDVRNEERLWAADELKELGTATPSLGSLAAPGNGSGGGEPGSIEAPANGAGGQP